MTFTPPPAILQKVLGFKEFEHKNGKLMIHGLGGSFMPYASTIFFLKLLEEKFGKDNTANIFYTIGKLQGSQTFELVTQKFGMIKTLRDKIKLLKFNAGQSDVAGNGHFEWVRLDFKKNIYIGKGTSPYAQEYKKLFGIQKKGIDFFMVGQVAGIIEEVTKIKMQAFETSCIATGKKFCEAIVFPKKSIAKYRFHKNFRNFKEYNLKKLNPKIDPKKAFF